MLKTELIGSWKLVDFEIEKPNGEIKKWGKKPHGLLIYSNDGAMSVAINSELEASASEKDLFDSLLFYSGTYDIMPDGRICHDVLNATDPERIGKKMIREGSLKDGVLHIVGSGDFGVARVKWKKR